MDAVMPIVELLVRLAPGFLSLLTGHATDAEAVEHARASIASLHPLDVHGMADRRRAELRGRAARLRPIVSSPALTMAERADLRALLDAHEAP